MFKVLLVCFRMCKIPTPFLPAAAFNKINDLAALIMFCNFTQVKMPKVVFNQSLEGLKVLHSYMLECEATKLTEEQFLNNLLKNPLENLSSLKSFFTKLPSHSW